MKKLINVVYLDSNKLFTGVSQINVLRKCLFLLLDSGENVLYFEDWL